MTKLMLLNTIELLQDYFYKSYYHSYLFAGKPEDYIVYYFWCNTTIIKSFHCSPKFGQINRQWL